MQFEAYCVTSFQWYVGEKTTKPQYAQHRVRLREFRGLAPKLCFGGAGSPKSLDHGDNPPPPAPPLHAVSPPPH